MPKTKRRVILLTSIILAIAATFIFANKDEIVFSILKSQKDLDLGCVQNPPRSYKYFCTKNKNDFLISKFNDGQKTSPTLCGCPLTCGDLAWCVFSDNNISEKQYELLMKEFGVDYGFAVFQKLRDNYALKMKALEIIGYQNKKIKPLAMSVD